HVRDALRFGRFSVTTDQLPLELTTGNIAEPDASVLLQGHGLPVATDRHAGPADRHGGAVRLETAAVPEMHHPPAGKCDVPGRGEDSRRAGRRGRARKGQFLPIFGRVPALQLATSPTKEQRPNRSESQLRSAGAVSLPGYGQRGIGPEVPAMQ